MSVEPGVLYVVATPIGNLADITQRAVEVLGQVDVIAAEDTRHSARLLRHHGIATPCIAHHEHNEAKVAGALLQRLRQGQSVALISDAGTPLISDPGFPLVREARAQGIRVCPIPGPSAVIAALSVSGLPSDRFVFEGFLPAKSGARRARLEALAAEPRTLIFYESPHRIIAALQEMSEVFGAQRPAVLARELTKAFETIRGGALRDLCAQTEADPQQQKGEYVVLVHGAAPTGSGEVLDAEAQRVLAILCAELPVKQAAALAAQICGAPKRALYEAALALKRDEGNA